METNSSNYVGFKAAAALGADIVWELPQNAGNANQVLSTNGSPSNQLSWVDAGGTSGQVQSGSIGASGLSKGSNLVDPVQFKLVLDASIEDIERGDKISYYVNGQLLLSGSATESTNGIADYSMVDVADVAASASITVGTPANFVATSSTVTVQNFAGVGQVFTAVASGAGVNQFNIDASDANVTASNLRAAINNHSDFTASVVGAKVTITLGTVGEAGNGKTINTNQANAFVDMFPVSFADGGNIATAKFGFDLEYEDVVQVIVR